MTEPTEAEIWQMWMTMVRRMGVADPVDFARAALAKWGTPQPTHAQAGAVTDAQVLAAVRVVSPNLFRHGLQPLPHDGANTAAQMRKEADTVRKMLEAAHGIKGKTK